jgi:serine protease AprX
MSSAVTAGAVALLLQLEPELTPDQVKYRLISTTRPFEAGNQAGYLDIYTAVQDNSTESANQGVIPHQLLAKMALIAYWASQNGGEDIDWENVNWSNVNWSSVNWSSVNWSSVNWSSVNWSSVNWSSVNWSSVNWSSVNWSSVNWSSVNWSSVNWSSVNWSTDDWDD